MIEKSNSSRKTEQSRRMNTRHSCLVEGSGLRLNKTSLQMKTISANVSNRAANQHGPPRKKCESVCKPPGATLVHTSPSESNQVYQAVPTHHAHQLPHRVTRLCANTEPVLGTRPVKRNLLVWARIGIVVVQVRRLLRDGVVGANNLEGLRAAGRPVEPQRLAISLIPSLAIVIGKMSHVDADANGNRLGNGIKDVDRAPGKKQQTYRACATTML